MYNFILNLKVKKLSNSKLSEMILLTLLHPNVLHSSLEFHVSRAMRVSYSYFEYPTLGPLTLKNLIHKVFPKVYFSKLTHLYTSLANMNGNNFSHFA